MVSRAHEELVARIESQGTRTPDDFPDTDDFAIARTFEAAAPKPPVGDCSVTVVDAGGVPALWVDPPGEPPARVVIYLHGGGYIWMSAHTHRGVMAAVATAAEARCLGVDYRRAPEHPYPAAVDDVVAAYRWLSWRRESHPSRSR
jgi:monoterpene epsilon-lactone hydrolase